MTQTVTQGVQASYKVVGVNKYGTDVAAPTPVAAVLDAANTGVVAVTDDTFTFSTDEVKTAVVHVTAGSLSLDETFVVNPDVSAVSLAVRPLGA
jgi:hypothetical protein